MLATYFGSLSLSVFGAQMKLTFMHLENKTNKTSDTMEEKEMNQTWGFHHFEGQTGC